MEEILNELSVLFKKGYEPTEEDYEKLFEVIRSGLGINEESIGDGLQVFQGKLKLGGESEQPIILNMNGQTFALVNTPQNGQLYLSDDVGMNGQLIRFISMGEKPVGDIGVSITAQQENAGIELRSNSVGNLRLGVGAEKKYVFENYFNQYFEYVNQPDFLDDNDLAIPNKTEVKRIVTQEYGLGDGYTGSINIDGQGTEMVFENGILKTINQAT